MPAATASALTAELQSEAQATHRLLSRIPADRLDWRPHPKSMTLGQLALHLATIPGNMSNLAAMPGFDASQANFAPPQPTGLEEIHRALDEGSARAAAYLESLEEAALGESWALSNGDRQIFALPRAGMLRTLLFNHWYHHRGQLTVYLRLLDVPVPATYGRSADENPFAA